MYSISSKTSQVGTLLGPDRWLHLHFFVFISWLQHAPEDYMRVRVFHKLLESRLAIRKRRHYFLRIHLRHTRHTKIKAASRVPQQELGFKIGLAITWTNYDGRILGQGAEWFQIESKRSIIASTSSVWGLRIQDLDYRKIVMNSYLDCWFPKGWTNLALSHEA